MFSLKEVGVTVSNNQVTFSLYLPGIIQHSFSVDALYISKQDQFNKDVPASRVPLSPVPAPDPDWGRVNKELWQSNPVTVPSGSYLYRYEICGPGKENMQTVRSLYFGDPFSRETSSGIFSVFHVGGSTAFNWDYPAAFRVPWIKDAIIYEINVAEFNYTFDGVVDRIPYLKSLGINVLELLPVTGISEPSNWGYTPIFYFAPEERFGGPDGLKRMVNECHKAGIAVVLDMVYPHADKLFPYQTGYDRFFDLWWDHEYQDMGNRTVRSPNPLVSMHYNFGHKNDFRMDSTIEFFKSVCEFWIGEYHIDGFRFDHVNGYLDRKPESNWDNYRPCFESLKTITNHVYQISKNIPRFIDQNGTSAIIQIAEDLDQGSYQLSNTGSAVNGCWEQKLYYASTDMAQWDCLNGNYLNELLLSDGRWNNYSGTKTVGSDTIHASPVVYHNSHDKSHLMYRIDRKKEWDPSGYDHPTGIENIKWYKLQPYAIALLTCVGTPMLWAGEEFAETYGIPDNGPARVRGPRYLHWNNFYTPYEMANVPTVLPLTTLYRNLCNIRNSHDALRAPRTNAVKEIEDFTQKIIVFRRWLGNQVIIVVINFSDTDKSQLAIPFGHSGTWTDILAYKYGINYSINVSDPAVRENIDVPSNFGRIFLLT